MSDHMSAEEFRAGIESGEIKIADGRKRRGTFQHDIFKTTDDEIGPDSMTFSYKGKTPSVNDCYATVMIPIEGARPCRCCHRTPSYPQRTLSKAGKAFKREIQRLLRLRKIREATWYRLDMMFSGPLLNKGNKKVKNWDRSNLIKLLEDSITKSMGFDDCHVIIGEESKTDGLYGFTATLSVWDGVTRQDLERRIFELEQEVRDAQADA